jgi:hypothetical protein
MGTLRFSDSAGARELTILKKSEDRSNISCPILALSCDARWLQGEEKTIPIINALQKRISVDVSERARSNPP